MHFETLSGCRFWASRRALEDTTKNRLDFQDAGDLFFDALLPSVALLALVGRDGDMECREKTAAWRKGSYAGISKWSSSG